MRGPAEPAPGYNLHPFESRSPRGRKRARPGADVRGEREIFRSNEAQRNGREKFIAKTLPSPDSKTGCACLSPGEWTQTGDTAPGKGAGTRRNDEERGRETALPPQSAGSFIAGTVKAARPERSQQALPLTLTSDIRH